MKKKSYKAAGKSLKRITALKKRFKTVIHDLVIKNILNVKSDDLDGKDSDST